MLNVQRSTSYICSLLLCCWSMVAGAQNYVEQTEALTLATEEERAEGFFLEGLRQQQAGHINEAYELFSHTLLINPQHVGALYELSSYARYMRQDSLAVVLLERAAARDNENFWLKRALVELYVDQRRTDDAVHQLEMMTHQYPERSDLLLMLAGMYEHGGDNEQLVRTLDRVELLEGKNEQLSMEKFRAYLRMKDEQRAFAEMQALADEYPNDMHYQAIIGDLLHDSGRDDEALAIFHRILTEHPDNVNAQLSMFNYYRDKKMEDEADSAVHQLLVNPQLDRNLCVQLMQALAYENVQLNADTTQMMSLFRQLLAQPQEDTRIPELAARYMITRNAPTPEVKPVLRQLLNIDPEEELARNQLLSYAIEEDDTSEIVRLCRTAVDYGSEDPVYYYYLAIGCFLQNKNKDAIDAAKRGLQKEKARENTLLITNLYAILGDLYHRTGQDNLAFEAYDSCLIYRPDDALVLNNYAYYLSLRKQDLKRAEQMSAKSLEKEGQNPTYLDTYAWILFQQKRYDEARVVIDTVIVLLGDSVTANDVSLIEHAGDIYAKCGQREQAVTYWQQALDLGGENALIEKKIRKRKYVEK